MKKIFNTIALFLIVNIAFAQTISVQSVEREANKIVYKGMGVNIELDQKFVEKEWKKKLKEFGGKSGSIKGATQIDGASISNISSNPIRIITNVEGSKGATEVWWVLDLGTEYVTSQSSNFSSAKKILHDFAVECYRADIMQQISEAEKEHEQTVKNYEKEIKTGENIVKNITSNKETIVKLQDENIKLEKDKTQNLKDQEQLKKDVETMKKKVEVTKLKLDKIK